MNLNDLKAKLPERTGFAALLLAFAMIAILGSSCATPDCPNCKVKKRPGGEVRPPEWNVALKSPIYDDCQKREIGSIVSDVKPDSIPLGESGKSVVRVMSAVPCADGSYKTYEIPYSNVLEVTSTSDPLIPPDPWEPDPPCPCCCAERDGVLFFDKLELRGMIGYRGPQDGISYPEPNGTDTFYEPSTFGTDRGGSDVVYGAEIAGMWSLDQNDAFQLGFLTGIWPMDGSMFVPVALHGRYTWNQHPNPYGTKCNAWYLFGDLGMPLDFETEAPFIGSFFDRQRYFWGIGFGHDIAISCDLDFSIDLGIRQTNNPLPPLNCCPDVPDEDKNPYRLSTIGFLRLGITF